MTYDLGWLQLAILAAMRTDPERTWLYVDVEREVYVAEVSPIQRQALQNSFKTLARRQLVTLNPPNCVSEWGQPEMRERARLTDPAGVPSSGAV